MDITFQSLQELYQRITPALITKKMEMVRNGYSYIKEEDIWNYLKEKKWKKSVGLSLCEMVDDVLNSEDLEIDLYLKEKLNRKNRTAYFDLNMEE